MTSPKEKKIKMEVPQIEGTSTVNVNDVFLNSLVLDNLVNFLSVSDIKSMSAVNKDFLRAVRGTKRWAQNVALLLTNDTNPNNEFLESQQQFQLEDYLLHSEERWRGVKIDFQLPPTTLDLVPRILESVEFLAVMSITDLRHEIQETNPLLSNFLSSVLSSTPKITHLQMDIRLWLSRLSDVLSSPAVAANLKNLKRLDILEPDYDNPGTFRASHGPTFPLDAWNWTQRNNFSENLSKLSLIPVRLESLKIAKVVDRAGNPSGGFLEHLLTILTNSRETLKELSVHLDAWKMGELRKLKMPALKRLTVTVGRPNRTDPRGLKYQRTLATFLKNHSTLEELDVEGDKKIAPSLFSAIQKHSTQLKKLHIKTHNFSGTTESVDWTFLGSMEHLKDFSIVKPKPGQGDITSYGTGRVFLASLPKDQLESLTFQGISNFNVYSNRQLKPPVGFWNSSPGEDIGLELKTQLLQGFTCLRRLSLINCLDSLDNHLMQFIVKEFKLLETLEVSHCSRLSDAGITGDIETGRESIAQLRSLKSLIIRACHLVTQDGILTSVTFPCLKSLEYMTGAFVPESFVLQLEEQNPSLETLTANFSGNWNQLKKQNSRLKRIGYSFKGYADRDREPGEPERRFRWLIN